ncbi:MAG: leucyl aminopeptidase [Planctomycetota bacterium]
MPESPFQSSTSSLPAPLPQPKLVQANQPAEAICDVAIIGVCDDGELTGAAESIDAKCNHLIRRLIDSGRASTDEGELLTIPGPQALAATGNGPAMILIVGLGLRSKLTRELAFRMTSQAVKSLVAKPIKDLQISLAENFDASCADAVVAGALFPLEGQAIYRTKSVIHCPDQIAFTAIDEATIQRGKTIGDSVNFARRLINEPASAIYPESLANRAAAMANEVGLEAEVWDEKKLATENCRAILAVGAGSERPPRLLILRHQGGVPGEAPVAIVGKGVTFDSGGLSIKPSDGMIDMKCDMGGAATVIGTMRAVAKLGLKKNIIGLCGMAENMVSGSSYKLGDVIETRSGKTIEILNTDAEGRVVLADTLNVAIEHKPSKMVDLATLTGACMVALGNEVTGVMANDQSVCDEFLKAAEAEGEPAWQLPMFELYDEKVKSKVADIKNIGEGRWGGAITAAKFLENFVGDTPWVHLDIAGPAFADSPKPHRDAGATGVMVRTLIRWIESQ